MIIPPVELHPGQAPGHLQHQTSPTEDQKWRQHTSNTSSGSQQNDLATRTSLVVPSQNLTPEQLHAALE